MTWRELLKAKGLTDAQIAEIEKTAGPAISEFDNLITTAEAKNQEAAKLAAEAKERDERINKFWKDEATPQINEAFAKVATAEAQAAFYKTQAEKAKENGFLPSDAPGYKPTENPDPKGTFVPGANPVPGSPKYMTEAQAIEALTSVSFLLTEHERLFKEPLATPLEELMAEAGKRGIKVRQVWEEKYKVPERRRAIAEEAQKAHDDKIAKETEEKVRREYADKYGNPETRPMAPSRFPKYARPDGGGQPDKLAWANPEAKARFRQKIHEQVAKETGSVQ